jgi:hypothetical protein
MRQLFFISIMVTFLSGCDSASDAPKIDQFQEGDECVLRTGNKDIIVARTKDELDRIVHLSVIKDYNGITLEVSKNRAFMVDAETKVKVITTSYTVSEIRIEGGQYGLQVGWVPNEFIKK